MGYFEAAHGLGGIVPSSRIAGDRPYTLSHISYSDETWHSYTLLEEDQKNYELRDIPTHPSSPADISIFSLEICNFCYIKTYRYILHFNT